MARKSAADDVATEVERALASARNPDGGWPYIKGRTSRIEPTAWAALGPVRAASGAIEWLAGAERVDGWYADDRRAPINYTFNGLVLLALLASGNSSPAAERLARRLLEVRGLAVPQSPVIRQDNSLQGWPWVGDTFSWVEPTACCLLAVKRAARCGAVRASAIAARVDEAERLLADRACAGGGWNYGNANVLGKNLRPYGPTTALALLALQDRRELPAVSTSLNFLAEHAAAERSGLALALTILCLRIYDRDVSEARAAARDQAARSMTIGNTVALATLRLALSDDAPSLQL